MVNAFSFCLYGPYNIRYYPGMLRNIELAAQHFPEWKVYVYVAPDVEPSMLESLASYPSVVLRETGVLGSPNMIHRFYAIDEPEVDLMLVRDADSRIHWKDRWAIRDFLRRPQFVAHAIRDNPEHKSELLGGLWGLRKRAQINVRAEYSTYVEDPRLGQRNGHDQGFLTDVIYPKIASQLLVHYSCGRFLRYEHVIEFPFEWTNGFYCGAVAFDAEDPPEPPSVHRVIETGVGPLIIPRRDTASLLPPPPPPPSSTPPTPSQTGSILTLLHRR
jgi:hypothetical protein